MLHEVTVHKTCLNGWWDFMPLDENNAGSEIPQHGWHEGQYLVPSFWTKSMHGVRKRGETYYHARRKTEIFAEAKKGSEAYEFLFDAFGYPLEWSKSRAGWVRRTLELDKVTPDRRYILVFDAVMPRARLFVNGHEICTHIHPTLPLEADITDYVHAGDNDIAVLVEDYARDAQGRALVPTGNVIPCDHSGIWQDVWLVERGVITLNNLTIRTSTRAQTLTLIYEVTNTTEQDQDVILQSDILDWQKAAANPAKAPLILALPSLSLHIPAGQTQHAELTISWKDAVWWCPQNPKLYWLKTMVNAQDLTEISFERFGFREVWIEGPNLMLNDRPIHLFSDWGHKSTPYYYTEGWIRQWFGMLRDGNMNHSRLHTHPHPQIYMDMADEAGILLTGETGLHGSGGAQAAASPEYWTAARDHVRRFVRRDKNHPSVILWSVENEMRWNTKGQGRNQESIMIQAELPKLRALFNALDPTRPAYHDGDSSLWNEKEQPIISRHYGKEVAGIGWWDQTQPLHSGEMALYHYAGPNTTLHLGGDAVYASFRAIDEAAARDAALIIETGRSLGVSCFGPWNQSCLENLRMTSEDMLPHYEEVTTPGVKPLHVPAHSSEFAFWDRDTSGYTPNVSFAIQAHAFRPLAIIDRSLKRAYFTGHTFSRDIFVVNDTPNDLIGILEVTLAKGDHSIGTATQELSVTRGSVVSQRFAMDIPSDAAPGTYEYTVTFRVGDTLLDTWTREITLCRSARHAEMTDRPATPIGVYGPGSLKPALDALHIPHQYVEALEAQSLTDYHILIMEKNTVQPGSTQNQAVQAFVQRGGRLVLMAQNHSLFPAIPLEDKAVLTTFVRAPEHPVLSDMDDEEFAHWGEDPYPLVASDSYVAHKLYRKDDGQLMLPLLDTGEGGFGHGDLNLSPLFEATDGTGLILACQLRLTDKLADTPAAERLFLNMLRRAASYQRNESLAPILVKGTREDNVERYIEAAEQGHTVIINNATPEVLHDWGTVLGIDLQPRDVGDVYQVVRVEDPAPASEWLSGVSNWDTCGIETFAYAHNVENSRVGETFITPVSGLEALLVTPTQSCLRELFVYGGRSEALRTHTLSRFLHAEKRQAAVALGRARVGKGYVVFNQFAPPLEKRARYRRLEHRLQANLGQVFEGSLLDGATTPAPTAHGPGYPQQLYVHTGPCSPDIYRHMVESTRPTLERMLATPILNIGTWHTHTHEAGVWHAEDLREQDKTTPAPLYLYYPIWSPRPRKNVATNLDVPNPEALTFLDLEGGGEVQITLNGHTYEPLILPATLSDLSLDMGGNHVLIQWTPDTPTAKLSMRWRNIMRQPEVGLAFGTGGSVD